jgi:RimJ/RimL family protein N-acetyltransferase
VSWTIRRLSRADAPSYRDIRLEALTNHPEAFFSAAEDFAQRTLAELETLLDQMAFYAAVTAEGELVGIMAYERGQKRQAHRGWLYQVYVKPQMRGSGCAQALLEAIIDHARTEVEQLHLSVESRNVSALRLYEKAGFKLYGTDPRYMSVNGRYHDEHLMVRFFDEAPGKTSNE